MTPYGKPMDTLWEPSGKHIRICNAGMRTDTHTHTYIYIYIYIHIYVYIID